ncbi:MAG: alpha/beta hydrolase [Clostridia bacterium]|nr:alpha/beta hydrolase [Clostridia bacterium]
MKFFKKKWRLAVVAIPLIIIIGMAIYVSDYYKPMNEAVTALAGTKQVSFKASPWLEYNPIAVAPVKGFIFYPGGKVAPEAYAPMAEKIAEQGFKAVIVPMPFHLAVFAPDKAREVMKQYPEIKEWFIGGHSLGGVMAAQFAFSNPNSLKGLVLLAAYPQKSKDLSHAALPVLSIYGTNDGFVGQSKIDLSKAFLPKDAIFLPIEGGNHSQMGWYGFQKGDKTATISREEQQRAVVQAITDFMNRN